MERWPEPKSEALRALYWRDEILEMMFWIKGEGLGDRIDPSILERFLGVDAAVGVQYLNRLVDEGLLSRTAEGLFELTEEGDRTGARLFVDSFAELTRPAHYECAPGCSCTDPAHAGEPCPNRKQHDD